MQSSKCRTPNVNLNRVRLLPHLAFDLCRLRSELFLLLALTICLLFPLPASCELGPRLAAARDYAFHGVSIGMSQKQLKKLLPRASRMTDALTGVTGAIDPAKGQEKWCVARLTDADNAYFEFVDSALYAISWNRNCAKATFVKFKQGLDSLIGPETARSDNSYTWALGVIQRRIMASWEAEVGMSMQVVDDEATKDLMDGQTGKRARAAKRSPPQRIIDSTTQHDEKQ